MKVTDWIRGGEEGGGDADCAYTLSAMSEKREFLSDKMLGIAKKGTVEELRRALPPEGAQRKAAVRQRTENGISLLEEACYCHRFDMATALVREFGFPVEDRDTKVGNTALIDMSAEGKAEAATFLIRNLGANRHAVDNQGCTALHMACDNGHTELALMLVRDFGLHLEATNNDGTTPLVQAALCGHAVTVISLINDLGARVHVVTTAGGTALHQAAAGTALHQAAAEGFTDTALALISIGGARIDAADKYGATPLHLACIAGHPTMVSALLAEGASLDGKDQGMARRRSRSSASTLMPTPQTRLWWWRPSRATSGSRPSQTRCSRRRIGERRCA